jgi:hypothetical protein
MTNALHFQNDLSVTRFESRLESLGRWGSGSNPRFLRRRPRNGWRKRDFESQLQAQTSRECTPVVLSQAITRITMRVRKSDSMLRQGLEVGLFGTYLLIFLASLWMLG